MTKRFEELDPRIVSTNRPMVDPSEVGSDKNEALAFAALFDDRAKDASQVEVAQKVSHPERLKFRNLAEAKQVVGQRLEASEGDPRLAARLLMELCNEYDDLIWYTQRSDSNSMSGHNIVWETVAADGKYYVAEMLGLSVGKIFIETYSAARKPEHVGEYYRVIRRGLPGVEETAEKVRELYLPRIAGILKKIGFSKSRNRKSSYEFTRKRWRKSRNYAKLSFDTEYVNEMMRLSISPDDDEELRNEVLKALREARLDIHPSTLVPLLGCFKIVPDLSNIVIL